MLLRSLMVVRYYVHYQFLSYKYITLALIGITHTSPYYTSIKVASHLWLFSKYMLSFWFYLILWMQGTSLSFVQSLCKKASNHHANLPLEMYSFTL